MKKLNKKGFTLVELLAVIVILALLIVVVANTALPALNNSKKKSLTTYAQRVAEKAKEQYMTDELNNSSTKSCYTVSELMGTAEGSTYSGIVEVTKDTENNKYTATVYIYDKDYMLDGVADNNLSSADPDAKGTLTKSSCS